MQQDPETGGPVGQVGNWVFIAFFYCLRAEMSLRCKQTFPGKEKCLVEQFSPFGTSCSLPFITTTFPLGGLEFDSLLPFPPE
jgi:hypothetical protein